MCPKSSSSSLAEPEGELEAVAAEPELLWEPRLGQALSIRPSSMVKMHFQFSDVQDDAVCAAGQLLEKQAPES